MYTIFSVTVPILRKGIKGGVHMERKALITGASRGIGRAIAIEFARAGYDLTLCCIKNIESLQNLAKDLADTYKVKCEAFQADVSKPDAVKELFSKIDPPSVLINNAGISYVGLITDMSDEDWTKTIDTNLSSVFYMSRDTSHGVRVFRQDHQCVICLGRERSLNGGCILGFQRGT